MTANWFGGRLVVLGAALAISAPITFNAAEAARTRSSHAVSNGHARVIQNGISTARTRYASTRRSGFRWVRGAGGGLQCVPFARENTGIELSGNANTWWDAAAGVYERGAKPEVGSILNFRATGRMRMGHVAVVSNVVDGRTIEIDHANWGRGRVNRDMVVIDISPANDWSTVRVGGGTGLYPTYGFIYDRPDTGTMLANTGVVPVQAASRVLPVTQVAEEAEEVAEAVDDTAPRYSRYRHHRTGRHTAARAHASSKPAVVVRAASRTSSAAKPQTTRRHRS